MLSLDLVLSFWFLLTLRLENLGLTLSKRSSPCWAWTLFWVSGSFLPWGLRAWNWFWASGSVLPWGWRTWAWPCQEAKCACPCVEAKLSSGYVLYLKAGELGLDPVEVSLAPGHIETGLGSQSPSLCEPSSQAPFTTNQISALNFCLCQCPIQYLTRYWAESRYHIKVNYFTFA